ncbi:MAG: hypothetical protein AMXMBFR12_05080 [Candidatus Babeliales bacterium]
MSSKQIFFFSVYTFLTLHSLDASLPSSKKPYKEPIQPYYGAAPFNNATPGTHHAPMLILFDPIEGEGVTSDNTALTSQLATSLAAPFYPILVSGYLLKNLLIRTKEFEPDNVQPQNQLNIQLKQIMDQAFFISSHWDMYDIPQSQLILLIPKVISNIFSRAGKNMGIEKLLPINNLLPEQPVDAPLKNKAYEKLIEWLDKNKRTDPLNPNLSLENIYKLHEYDLAGDLKKVFTNKTDISTPVYEDYYKSLKQLILKNNATTPQKSISTILQEKQRQILLKKAVEIKRKEAAETAVKGK